MTLNTWAVTSHGYRTLAGHPAPDPILAVYTSSHAQMTILPLTLQTCPKQLNWNFFLLK